MTRKVNAGIWSSAAVVALVAAGAVSQEGPQSLNMYGETGLIDMPTADSAPDAQITSSFSGYADQQRITFGFQITPRLSGTFRYSHIDKFGPSGAAELYDRSFDIRYRVVEETEIFPNISLGLRDFMGTGYYTSEYLVATKGITDNIRVTGGLGWGRLASRGGFTNPLGVVDSSFETRPGLDVGQGGVPSVNQFFRGDAALFGGVEWQFRDNWTAKAEYSSDAYARETATGKYSPQSPFNFGIAWQPRPEYELSAYYINGTDIGVSGSVILNPLNNIASSGYESAPIPVNVRAADVRAAQTWDKTILSPETLGNAVSGVLAADGIIVDGFEISDGQVRLRYTNTRYRSETEAAGRVARILTHAMPPSVEVFVLEPMNRGLPTSQITLRRSDIEDLENTFGAGDAIAARAVITSAGPNTGLQAPQSDRPAFTWGLIPDVNLVVFDPKQPFRGDLGLQLSARYEIQPNLVVAGAIRKSLLNNNTLDLSSISVLPKVRTDADQYAAQGDPGLQYFTLAYYGHLAPDIYSRVTVGYLETMYAGVSTELLWKPVDNRLALGAELNYVMQRDFDMGFGVRDYDVVTGHVSAYYAFDNGFHGEIDIGRYLAGDWGATFALDREFNNGWRVGAYFTLTDVPFEDFGEGSFDKGIRVSVPFDWFSGQSTPKTGAVSLASLTRDGGARLNVEGRLYDTVRTGQSSDFGDTWGRFWR